MTVLVLMEKETKLFLREGQICCKIASQRSKLLPWSGIQHIVLGKGVDISTQLILCLADKGVTVLIHGSKNNELASVIPLKSPTSSIKLQQYKAFADPLCCRRLSLMLLKIRMSMQFNYLQQLNLSIDKSLYNVKEVLHNSEHLMLQEAKISKYYWQQLSTIFARWGFTGRVRRPPTDPVNALLSLSSVMVDSMYNHALLVQGLDLGLGFHHQTGYRRQSLICDLKELSRVALESWVMTLFVNEQLTQAHFCDVSGGCRLTREGQIIFYKAWYRFAYQHQPFVNRIARLSKKIILREAKHAK
ncbi:CRISPR-associated endonuclease Cas1 [Psychromonas arctica]|uniref:CRISPR-associated endonuclease Cas1 n=1 Tax=Psychromonas arctica TaxID=168275 RepID=UPI002FD3068D